MEYCVLGQLRVDGTGGDLTPAGQRARDVLAVLLTRREQFVDPQVLLDLVWGDKAASLDVSVVHTVVARLRRTLGRDQIERTGQGYRLRGGATDEEAFADLVDRAEGARGTAPEDELALLREALGLWRADRPYADVSPHLVAAETGRLREWRSSVTQDLGALLLRRGDRDSLDELIQLAHDFVLREPLTERAHELLMLGLWRAGREAEALETYERFRVLLRDELGVDPSAPTARLHQQMLRQDPALGASPGTAGQRTRPAPPAPTTPLVGREAELAGTLDLLAARRLVVVTGLGGIGKSRLLSEVHARLDPGTASAFLDLATLGPCDRDDLAEALARALEVRLDPDDQLAALARSSALADLLLIVDEAERSSEAVASVVADLLAQCPTLTVLVASRHPLGVVGESTVTLDPLPVPAEDADVEETAAAPSVRLLRDRIGDHAPDLVAGPAETLTLGRLARRADGLPLALELLAGYAGTHSLAELDAFLDSPADLASADLGRPERHRTLGDTIQWSVDRLPDGHQQVLRRLGVFSGSFELTAAVAVAGGAGEDVDRVTRALVRDGLVQARREDHALVLRLPRAVQDLAAALLEESGERDAVQARHRRWHATERWRGELRNDRLLADMRTHYPDYLAALRSGLEARDSGTVGAVVLTLGRYWGFTDMIPVGVRWFGEVIASGLVGPLDEARIRISRAHLAVHHDPAGVRADIEAALPLLTEAGDAPYVVTGHIIAALERFEAGELELAETSARQAVEAAERAPRERQADALGVLALVQATSRPEQAAETARTAWARATAGGNPASRASVATNVALALMELGRAEEAMTLFRDAAADMGEDAVPLFLVFNRSWAELLLADHDAALDGFAQVVAASGDAPADRQSAEAFVGIACALAALGRPEAPELVAGADELRRRTGLVLQQFQAGLFDRARGATDAWTGLAWPETASAVGSRLAGLVHAAV